MADFIFLSKDDLYYDFKKYLDDNFYIYSTREQNIKGYNEYVFIIHYVDDNLKRFINYTQNYI